MYQIISVCIKTFFVQKQERKEKEEKEFCQEKKSLWRQLSLDAVMKLAEITFGVLWNIPKLRLVFSLRRLS